MSTALATRGYLCHRQTFVLPDAPSIAMGMEIEAAILGSSIEDEQQPAIRAAEEQVPLIQGAVATPAPIEPVAPAIADGAEIVPSIRKAEET